MYIYTHNFPAIGSQRVLVVTRFECIQFHLQSLFSPQNLDYVALSHANLNVDNAYYWRDEAWERNMPVTNQLIQLQWMFWMFTVLILQKFVTNDEAPKRIKAGRLCCGVLDWGGFGATCLGHKLWWYFNCSEFELLKERAEWLTCDLQPLFFQTCGRSTNLYRRTFGSFCRFSWTRALGCLGKVPPECGVLVWDQAVSLKFRSTGRFSIFHDLPLWKFWVWIFKAFWFVTSDVWLVLQFPRLFGEIPTIQWGLRRIPVCRYRESGGPQIDLQTLERMA